MELVNLTLNDVDAQEGLLMVRRGKGRKDRFLPLGTSAGSSIDRYLGDARPRLGVAHGEQGELVVEQEPRAAEGVQRVEHDVRRVRGDRGRTAGPRPAARGPPDAALGRGRAASGGPPARFDGTRAHGGDIAGAATG